MVANPEKLQCMILSRNGEMSIPLSVHNNNLYSINEIKLLNAILGDRLNFKSHVTDICNRASRQIDSFKMFSKYLKLDRWLSMYNSFIQSNLSYGPLAWIFSARKNSEKGVIICKFSAILFLPQYSILSTGTNYSRLFQVIYGSVRLSGMHYLRSITMAS